jgi:dCMP deaminase
MLLKSGVNPDNNPKVLMFQGAVGRAYHKLYEPFMAYKDELKILTGLEPIQRKTKIDLD